MHRACYSGHSLGRAIALTLMLSGLMVGFRWHQGPDVTIVHVAGRPLAVEIASDPSSRARGLQHRTSLPLDAGMLFVFPEPTRAHFWMKDTVIDLDVGFFDEQCRLIDVCQMTALDVRTRCAPGKAAKYALEVNRGWFAANRIPTNARLSLPRLFEAR